jgi:DNA-directed RNA polymerase subunit L
LTAADVAAGRPRLGAPPLRKRPNLTIRLTAELYGEIQKAADRAGRSLSEEVERRLETAAEWHAVFESVAAFKARYEADRVELERGNTEAVLPRRGYMKVLDPRYGGHAWVPPGQQIISDHQIINQLEWPDHQIINQLGWNERQAAQKAKAAVKTAADDINQQIEDLERRIRSLRDVHQKG